MVRRSSRLLLRRERKMPKVDGKTFSYDAQGMKDAAAARKAMAMKAAAKKMKPKDEKKK